MKIAKSAKTNTEVWLKKTTTATTTTTINPCLKPKNIFQKIYCREYKGLFLVAFNIIINYSFPETFIEIQEAPQKILIFTSLILTISSIFWSF